jgi:CNT family concentrative nucleoside transporter
MPPRLISLLGLLAFLVIAWLLSNKRSIIPVRTLVAGIALQFAFALFMLKTEVGIGIFKGTQEVVAKLNDFSDEGARMAFGPLASKEALLGAFPNAAPIVFAVTISATIILISALSALLYYWGVLQRIVGAMAWVMRRVMGTSGSESLAAASNIFLGQTEAALLVKPYIAKMSRSEIMALMTGGMATIATGVMVVYPTLGMSAGHILVASVLCAPASLFVAKLMYPETQRPSGVHPRMEVEKSDVNSLDALCRGTSEGVILSINVMGMLIAFTAIVALFNACLVGVQEWCGVLPQNALGLQTILGKLNAPFAWLMGVPSEHCAVVGQALGERVVLNEFVGYLSLSKYQPIHWDVFGQFANYSSVMGNGAHLYYLGANVRPGMLDERSFIIATYALCGFANFASIAIQIGGIGAMAPERRHDLARIGFRAMIGGLLACYITAALIGILI